MQSSIKGPLLRSGQNSAFKALGETGIPVYRMAPQLLETIRRLDSGHDLVRHLAIPQGDQEGDRTDWYSSFTGDVVPWNRATESERLVAYSQFESFKLEVLALSERLLTTDDKHYSGDKRVFASLLRQIVNFPDQDFIYLVDGVLVMTFWGFVHDNNEPRDPMYWLRPHSASLARSGVAVNTPVKGGGIPLCDAVAATDVTQDIPVYSKSVTTKYLTESWWRWLLWLLLLLALLALLLFGLRACTPNLLLPGLSSMNLPSPRESTVAALSLGHVQPVVHGSSDLSATVPDRASEPHTSMASAALASGDPLSPISVSLTSGEKPASAIPQQATMTGEFPTDLALSTLPPANPLKTDLSQSNSLPQVHQDKALMIPPTIVNGPARFLDGDWKVNGGIQDTQTGKPLQLQYSFKDGKGNVSLRQSNGVVCRGVASGVMNDGQLSINNPGQAKCGDGSSYTIPQITCQLGTDNGTDCVGSNDGEQQFPIMMRQKNP